MSESRILTIDQGTTSTRVIVFDQAARVCALAQEEFPQHYPKPGWVEHDPEDIWNSTVGLIPQALEQAGLSGSQVDAVAVANQRETTVVWDRKTHQPIHRAIVWQDNRTTDYCDSILDQESSIQQRTGLVVSPYFSGTKIRWLLDTVSGARAAADAGELAFGTVDSFLIWRLSAGESHVTDHTNASRTLLLNLESLDWDQQQCELLSVPPSLLPAVQPSSSHFGSTRGLDCLPDGIPILGVAGDQQASLIGQGCYRAGEAKCTYGTGAFLLVHTGSNPVRSQARLLTTLAATVDQTAQYALEGSVFVAGAAVQWLRDGLKMIEGSREIEALAGASDPASRVVFVPALAGLGAPHWNSKAEGTLFGITRGTSREDIARATLEGLGLQVADLIGAIRQDYPEEIAKMRVDGGASANNLLMQFQSDVLDCPLERVAQTESTALGAALVAGIAAGIWSGLEEVSKLVGVDHSFSPAMDPAQRAALRERWTRCIETVLRHY